VAVSYAALARSKLSPPVFIFQFKQIFQIRNSSGIEVDTNYVLGQLYFY